MAQMDKRSWCAEYRGLCQRVKTSEGECRSIYGSRELAKEVLVCRDETSALNRRREAAMSQLQTRLAGLRGAMHLVGSRVEAVARGETVGDDVGLTKLDNELAEFRSRMRREYDELRSQSQALWRDVEASARRFECWDDETPARPAGKSLGPPSCARTNRETRIAEIDAQLSAGPALGGWRPDEHEVFERIWTRTSGFDEVAALATKQLTGRDVSAVFEHCEWYAQRLSLLNEKRDLAKQWRDRKRDLDEARKEEADRNLRLDRILEKKANKEKQEALRDARDAARASAQAWRYLKDLDQRRAKLEADAIKQRAVRRQAERRAAELERRRPKLDAYKNRKALPEPPKPATPPPPPPKALIASNAQRSLDAARRRRDAVLQKRQARDGNDLRLRQLGQKAAGAVAQRDAARLLRPTSSSKVREFVALDDVDDQDERDRVAAHCKPIPGGGYDLNFFGRAVPAWRRPTSC